jgi:hypothetical protein
MALLKLAVNQTAYLKTGILGFEGSGKTRTAVEIAIGMTKLVKGKKVAFFDTEKGSDFHIERFKAEGIELFSVKSKAFIDLVDTIREAEKAGFSFLIIDSISHVWRELTESYLKRKKRDRLSMADWGVLKQEWAQFTDAYVNSKLHIAMLGRAGYEYAFSEDDDGKMQIHKSGTKMKVEGETGYEPDLLLEMSRVRKSDETGNLEDKGFINRCTVLKDRTDTMNGSVIDFPSFKSFEPIMKFLNIGGEHVGTDEARNSQAMFGNPDRSWAEAQKQKEIEIERLSDVLTLAGLKGTSGEVVAKRTKLLVDVFGGSGQTFIANLKLEALIEGIDKIKNQFNIGLKAAAKAEDVLTAEDSAL